MPWYAIQDGNGLLAMGQVFGGERTANGLLQALAHGRPWLAVGVAGLAAAAVAALLPPGRRQGAWLVVGAGAALLALLASGFLIGARGWAFETFTQAFGEFGGRQPGIGWGGAVALVALVMLTAFGFARRGFFRGDLFVAAAVLGCAGLLALFIVFPILKALASAFLTEDGQFAAAVVFERIASERNFGLACLTGGQRCGVALNTLFLGLMTATSTTVLGTLMALMAERTTQRATKTLKVLAMLPIITPPFVVGLGLILLFGRAARGPGEPVPGVRVRHHAHPLVLRLVRRLGGADLRLRADRLHDHARRGMAPSLEEAAHYATPDPNLPHRDAAPPQAGTRQRLGFIESMADFGNPIWWWAASSTVLSTEIFFAIVGAQCDQAAGGDPGRRRCWR